MPPYGGAFLPFGGARGPIVVGMRRPSTAVAATIAMLAATATAHAASTTTLQAPSQTRWWDGQGVTSIFAPATGLYTLSTFTATAAPTPVPGVAPQPADFQADIGPGPTGAAILVYRRCPAASANGTGLRCRLYRNRPAGGAQVALTGANGTGGYESSPTVWRSTLAFVRTYNRGGSQVVYTRPLTAGSKVRSRRLPAVPSRFCFGHCQTVSAGTVPELALNHGLLAAIVRVPTTLVGVCGVSQVHVIAIGSARDTIAASTICGLSGQTDVGVGWAGTQLLWARSCPGDPGGCGGPAVALRFSPATHRLWRAPLAGLTVGFAATGPRTAIALTTPNSTYAATPNACAATGTGAVAVAGCTLAPTGPLAFTASRR